MGYRAVDSRPRLVVSFEGASLVTRTGDTLDLDEWK